MASDDRTVYARDRYVEVVRYDRAGHWYIEPFSGKRVQVTVEAAARRATVCPKWGGWINLGLSGGNAFDRAVERLQVEKPTATVDAASDA